MTCGFCERRMDYLLSKHMHFCCMCGDALHAGVFPTRERLERLNGEHAPDAAAGKVTHTSKVYMNAIEDESGRICPECAKRVTRSDPRAVYCSLECQSRYNGRRQREKKRAAMAGAQDRMS